MLCVVATAPCGVVEAQATEPGTAIAAAVCSFPAVGLLGGAPLAAATLTADGASAIVASDAAIALVSTRDCSVIAQAAQAIAGVSAVLVTDAGRVVVVGAEGVWVWEPGLTTSRAVLPEPTSAAIHVGGEAIVVASEATTGNGALLRRIDTRTGQVIRRRTIPATDEHRSGVDSFGWDARHRSLLVLTSRGDLLRMSASSLSRPTLVRSYDSAVEHRDVILTAESELLYEALRMLRPNFHLGRISQDGRRALLASFETYQPTPSPSRWMLWTPGTALPSSVTGPAAPSPFHRVDAVASGGRTLFCEHVHMSPPDEADRSRERCWVVDL